MTKNVHPDSLIYCIRQCMFVFLIQIMIALAFSYEVRFFTDFQGFFPRETSMRIICSILIQLALNKELTKSLRMLTYLKRQRRQAGNIRGHYMNIMLSSMQIIASFATQLTFLLQVSQEPLINMITKAFVALLFVTSIDDTFAASFPKDVVDNADQLNDSGIMQIGKDQNSFEKIFKRLCRSCNCTEFEAAEAT